MEKKQLIIVAVIAVVAVAAVAAFVLMNNNGGNTPSEDDDKVYSVTSRLLVFGNANNDNYLDDDDVEFIQKIVDGASWDSDDYPLADANADGKITSDDVALVKKFLKGQSATMYYVNWYGNKASINYPLSGTISGYNLQCLDVAIIAGVDDDFLGLGESSEKIKTISDEWYPGASSKLISVRGDGNNFDIQSLLSVGTKVLLGDPAYQTTELRAELQKADSSINCIQLPINRVATKNDMVDWTHTVVTLGAMYNKQENTAKYIDYLAEVEDTISDQLSKIKAAYGSETFAIAYMPGETTTDVDFYSERFDEQYGDVMNLMRLPLTDIIDVPDAGEGWASGFPIEKLIALNPDVVFVETWNLINSESEEAYKESLETYVKNVSACGAYQNDRVITIAYEVYGTIPGVSGLVYLAHLLWPDLFPDAQVGIDIMNEYYRNFTNMPDDFDVSEHIGYLPEKYGATA